MGNDQIGVFRCDSVKNIHGHFRHFYRILILAFYLHGVCLRFFLVKNLI